jgi:hypothetical protein
VVTLNAAAAGDPAATLWISQEYARGVYTAATLVAATVIGIGLLATTTWSAVLMVVGSVVGLGAAWATLRRFRSVVRAVSAPANPQPRHVTLLSTIAEFVLGVAILALVTISATAVIRGLDQAGGGVTSAEGVLGVRAAIQGVAWHAADTVPLVSIPKAWGWDEPWQTNPNDWWPWAIGAVLFAEQAVVAIGLAEAITATTGRAIKGTTST